MGVATCMDMCRDMRMDVGVDICVACTSTHRSACRHAHKHVYGHVDSHACASGLRACSAWWGRTSSDMSSRCHAPEYADLPHAHVHACRHMCRHACRRTYGMWRRGAALARGGWLCLGVDVVGVCLDKAAGLSMCGQGWQVINMGARHAYTHVYRNLDRHAYWHVYRYLYRHVWTCVDMYGHVSHVCTCVHMCAHVLARLAGFDMRVEMCADIFVHISLCTYLYIGLHACRYTFVYT